MAIFKITQVFFQADDVQPSGWTEQMNMQGTDPNPLSYITRIKALCDLRVKMSGRETSIPYFRIQNVANPNSAFLYIPSPNSANGNQIFRGFGTKASDIPTTTIKMRGINVDGTKRRFFDIHAPWDEVIDTGGQIIETPTWRTKYVAWRDFVNDPINGLGWLSGTNKKQSNIAGIVDDLNQVVTITLADPIFAGNDQLGRPWVGQTVKVRVSKVTGAKELKGSRPWLVKTTTTIESTKPIAHLPYTGGGKVAFTEPAFQAYNSVAWTRSGEHKVGRPLFARHGRFVRR